MAFNTYAMGRLMPQNQNGSSKNFWLLFLSLVICCRTSQSRDFYEHNRVDEQLYKMQYRARLPLKHLDRKIRPGTRPKPSEELPVRPPKYPTDKSVIPAVKDLDPVLLRDILGKHYDPIFMSTVRPLEALLHPNGTLVYNFKQGRSFRRRHMPTDFKNIFSANFFDSRRLRSSISKHARRKVQRYLWAFSYCPVLYKWRDLGVRFWPRWIREGNCYNRRSCSVPAGMSCKVSDSTTKTLLWWHCRKPKCKWILIRYPIITSCSCKC